MKKRDVPELELTAEQLATVRAWGARNAAFWDGLKEPATPTAPAHPGVAPLVAEAWRLTVIAARQEAVRACNRARSAKAAKASAAKRAQGKPPREAGIRDARAKGRKPKQIAAEFNLSVQTVRKILARPRP